MYDPVCLLWQTYNDLFKLKKESDFDINKIFSQSFEVYICVCVCVCVCVLWGDGVRWPLIRHWTERSIRVLLRVHITIIFPYVFSIVMALLGL